MAFLLSILAAMSIIAFPVKDFYPMTAVVTNLDYQEDIATIEDANGFIWKFAGCEDYAEGDIVSAIMSDNGTDEITDDIIVSIEYSGFRTEE